MGVTVYFSSIYASEIVLDDINTRVKKALNANGIKIQLSTISHNKLDIIALNQNHLLSFGCLDFIFWNTLSFTKSPTT